MAYQSEMTASDCVYQNMMEFGVYTLRTKMPNVIDGLKPVQRRILLSLHNKPETAKESTVAGRVMEMHPHGDQSISDAISNLAKPFNMIIPLVDSKSNLGTYVGNVPAAARYLDVRAAETAEDIYFKGTDASVLKIVPCESEKGTEPAYFVPIIPMVFLLPTLGIAYSYKTETSAFSVANVCALAKKFVELRKQVNGAITNPNKLTSMLAKYMIPDFPSSCTLRNEKQIVSEYAKGNFDCPFVLDGLMKLTKDTITVSTLPPDRVYRRVVDEAGSKAVKDKNSWFYQHFQHMTDIVDRKRGGCMSGNFMCQLRRGENPFLLLTQFKKFMQMTSTWKPTRLYFDESGLGMCEETPISLLQKWYTERYRVVLGSLKLKLKQLTEQFHRLMALVIIVDHAKEVCEIFRKAKDGDDTISVLRKKYGLTEYQAKYLQSLRLAQLTAKGKQDLLDEIDEVKRKNAELQKKFTKVDDEILAAITSFEKKYASQYPPRCVSRKYIGTACYKQTGWIMLESIAECDDVINTFDSENITLRMFNDKYVFQAGSDDPAYDPFIDPSKYACASNIMSVPCRPKWYAVVVDGGYTIGPIPSVMSMLKSLPTPIGDKCTVIYSNGIRDVVTVDSKITRQSINATSPSLKGAIYVSPIYDEEVVVVHCNPKMPGVINIDRIKGKGKISLTVVGKTQVIGVYRPNESALMSFPLNVAMRTSVKHMYVKSFEDFVPANSTVKLLLTKQRTSNDRQIVRFKTRSSLYTIA